MLGLYKTRLKQWQTHWQKAWKHWIHTMLMFRPVVKRAKIGVKVVPVHWVSPVKVNARGLTFSQHVSTASAPLLSATTAINALQTLNKKLSSKNGLAAITQRPKNRQAKLLSPLGVPCQPVRLSVPKPLGRSKNLFNKHPVTAKPWQWKPPAPPAAFRLKRLAVTPPVAKRIRPFKEKTRVHANSAPIWKITIKRQPVAAHRFNISVRNVLRLALAKQAGVPVAEANTILLTTVVDRIPGKRVAHLQLHEDGAVTYRLTPPKKTVAVKPKTTQTGVVVVGRNLRTRQTIRTFVPAEDYIDL